MESKVINRKRSQLFIHLYGFSSVFHFILNQLSDMNAAIISPIFGMVSYLLLLILMDKLNTLSLQYTILFAMNSYIFIMNFESFSSITLVFFVVPIIAAALYNETTPILIVGLVTFFEFILFLTVFDRFVTGNSLSYSQLSILVFTVAV